MRHDSAGPPRDQRAWMASLLIACLFAGAAPAQVRDPARPDRDRPEEGGEADAETRLERIRQRVREGKPVAREEMIELLRVGGDPDAYQAAYEQGAKEAEAELAEGRAVIYVYGLRPSLVELHRPTGLPCRAIAGCMVNETILGRAAGHNERIRAYIDEHGVPSNSYKPWESIIFDLAGSFEDRAGDEELHHLTIGGPPAVSPDGRFAARVVADPDATGPARLPHLVIGPAGDGPAIAYKRFLPSATADLFFGPEGSPLVFFRHGDESGGRRYHAVDLETRQLLRSELERHEPTGPRSPGDGREIVPPPTLDRPEGPRSAPLAAIPPER